MWITVESSTVAAVPRLAPLLAVALLAVVVVVAARASRATPEPAASAIRAASIAYGVPRGEMIAVSYCETGGDFNPRSLNRSSGAAGLFQFLRATWARTPYRGFDRFDAYANALAAAWLVRKDGGWREWTCRP